MTSSKELPVLVSETDHIASSLTDRNRQHFNTTAHTYDNVERKKVAQRCAQAILEEFGIYEENRDLINTNSEDGESARNLGTIGGCSHIHDVDSERLSGPDVVIGKLDEDTTELLDFASGTGLISQQLCPYVHSILGVDTSEKMTEIYNQKCWQQGLSSNEMQAVCVDLFEIGIPEIKNGVVMSRENDPLKGRKFDVIVCASSYHHLPDIQPATLILASYLKPGGHLVVVDLALNPDYSYKFHNHQSSHTVKYPGGFSEGELVEAFEKTGLLENVKIRKAFHINMVESEGKEHPFDFFLVRGQRRRVDY
ncbi:hypothetical protein G9A89_019666 [Geosiphon pyriformis]|nr:hypothetical protein G9A89_019666 [Geosiphon pyriformis]